LRRPPHAPAAVAHVIRHWREGHQLVYVVPQRPNTTSSHSDIQFDTIGSRLWSPARFDPRSDLVSPVHCRPAAARQTSSSHAQAYADDTQLYGHCQPSDAGSVAQRVVVCINAVSAWMKANRLQLNIAKTEVLWCASSQRQHLVPTASVSIGDVLVSPVTAARDLGVHIDTDVTMRTHVTNTVERDSRHCACRSGVCDVPCHKTFPATARCANIGPCIGHHQTRPLQLGPCRCCWLPSTPAAVCAERCRSTHLFSPDVGAHNPTVPGPSLVTCTGANPWFRLCVVAYHCVHGTAPAYLADSLRLTSEVAARRRLRSADTTTLLVPPTQRVTFGDRAFPVAAARAWNSLPAQIRAASPLLSFRRQTKSSSLSSVVQLAQFCTIFFVPAVHHVMFFTLCKLPLQLL